MTPRADSSLTATVVDVGLELLPWIGLAVGLTFSVPADFGSVLPGVTTWFPLVTLVTGGAVVFARRSTGPFSWTPLPHGNGQLEPAAIASEAEPRRPAKRPQSHQEKAESVGERSSVDALTGLATRTALLDQLSRLLDASDQTNGGLALLSITIDEYRDVTESFGYDAGQELLAAVATRIERTSPPTSTGARIAEDTFCVLLTHDGATRGRELGEKLVAEFGDAFEIAGQEIPLEATMGLATHSDQKSGFANAEDMLQASYSAMHQAQREGGTKLNVHTVEDGGTSPWLERRERLRTAIQNDELVLHYQPVIHLVLEEIVGAEALVRWNHPDRGLLQPAAFLPLAEETGLVGEIDRWVFQEALQQQKRWTQPAGKRPVNWISVNVSPQSTDDDFKTWCLDQLENESLRDGSLHLEITERRALEDERALQPLREQGIRLVIDDFGTGYSSLRYLRSLDADVLKIDREFIHDLGQHQKTTAIVQFLLNLSLRLDVSVIAEGVETEEQEATLRQLGCAMAQGYHFSEPVPPQQLVEQTQHGVSQVPSRSENVLQPA